MNKETLRLQTEILIKYPKYHFVYFYKVFFHIIITYFTISIGISVKITQIKMTEMKQTFETFVGYKLHCFASLLPIDAQVTKTTDEASSSELRGNLRSQKG